MCGIAGTAGFRPELAQELVELMCADMMPRGPDDGGVLTFGSSNACVALGNRRLAIIDPSPAGHQPMLDTDRGVALVFNGMIYNFAELRGHLKARGEVFQSDCDTEVVLRAYAHYGRDFLSHLRGMFALAIWDSNLQELFLARDRLGIKPLYVYRRNGHVVFASQVKSLMATGIVPFTLSADAVESYLASATVDEPLAIIDGVQALPAGHSATITSRGFAIERWWDFPAPGDRQLSRADAAEELGGLLREAVDLHLVSDAPIGVFLSGGLDSSVIAGLAIERHERVRSVSVTFDERQYSEERYIDTVVKHLGTTHVNVRLDARELLTWSQQAFAAMDQPSYDGINLFTVSRAAAASGLKVALSGLGADELFNGYNFARNIEQLERLRKAPRIGRAIAARGLARLPGARPLKPAAWLRGELPRDAAYELLRRAFLPHEIRIMMPGRDGRNVLGRPRPVRSGPDVTSQLAIAEMSSYMRNVLLRDTDAMSMSQSLEVRVPFLDDRLVDWTFRLAPESRGFAPKELLLKAADGVIPREVLARRKQGFVLPLENWMRHDLHSRMDELFSSPPSLLDGLLDVGAVKSVWRAYLGGTAARFNGSNEWLRPWSLYVLYEWTESLMSGRPAWRGIL